MPCRQPIFLAVRIERGSGYDDYPSEIAWSGLDVNVQNRVLYQEDEWDPRPIPPSLRRTGFLARHVAAEMAGMNADFFSLTPAVTQRALSQILELGGRHGVPVRSVLSALVARTSSSPRDFVSWCPRRFTALVDRARAAHPLPEPPYRPAVEIQNCLAVYNFVGRDCR